MSSLYYLYQTIIGVPFTGTLVKYRASYNSKEVEKQVPINDESPSKNGSPVMVTLDSPSSSNDYVKSEVTMDMAQKDEEYSRAAKQKVTFLWVLKRTFRTEGFEGLGKGLLPTLVFSYIWPLIFGYLSPSPPTLNLTLKQSFKFLIFYVPALTTIYRVMTTALILEADQPPSLQEHFRFRFQRLFTPYERNRLWVIYLTPGLLPAMIIVVIVSILGLRPLNELIWATYKSPESLEDFWSKRNEYLARMALSILVCYLGTMIFAPLEVVITRLVIQRNHAAPELLNFSLLRLVRREPQQVEREEAGEDQTSDPVDADLEQGPDQVDSGTLPGNAVVQFRQNLNLPKNGYTGLIDCITTIVKEEGVAVLYRGSFISVIGTGLWMLWSI